MGSRYKLVKCHICNLMQFQFPPPNQRISATMSSFLSVLLLLFLFFTSNSCSSQTIVERLPGFPGELPLKLETGYIGVGENEEAQLFYYFAESENNPEKDPLVLWLTGGPGCTSLFGTVHKMGVIVDDGRYFCVGPLIVDYTKSDGSLPTLMVNPDSWTQVANIIFLDQPAGAGFSDANTSKAYYTDDTQSAARVYEFLRKWLINHPKYIENRLYIGGDSYAGVFVPLVVDLVFDGIEAGNEPHMNMKGYIVGNPVTTHSIDINGRVMYAHRMGLLSDELYQSAKTSCNENYTNVDPSNGLCLNDLERINQCLEKICLSHILEPWCASLWRKKEGILSWPIPSAYDEEFEIPSYNILHSDASTTPSCRNVLYRVFNTWANDKSVQKALNVRHVINLSDSKYNSPHGTITEWVRCNKTFKNDCYTLNVKSVVPYHKHFTEKTCRALVYSGDHDLAIPHTATKKWVDSLGQPVLTDWRPWFVGGQVAGYTVRYGHSDYDLMFVTVKDGGHTATEYKPTECFTMVSRWFDEASL